MKSHHYNKAGKYSEQKFSPQSIEPDIFWLDCFFYAELTPTNFRQSFPLVWATRETFIWTLMLSICDEINQGTLNLSLTADLFS